MIHRTLCTAILAAVLLSGCAAPRPAVDRNTLTQVATLDALMRGAYDGTMRLSDLRPYGDSGLGTFDKLDGEMVLLDGTFYRVPADGIVQTVALDETTPFAAVTFFERDRGLTVPAQTDYDGLRRCIDALLPTSNIFYTIRLDGTFASVTTRSVPAQTPPYRPLAEIAQTQPVFAFTNVTGTMIGFWCPAYASGINAAGYHLHFLTADRRGGGHVLGFETQHVQAQIDDTPNFLMLLPRTPAFYQMDLAPRPAAPAYSHPVE